MIVTPDLALAGDDPQWPWTRDQALAWCREQEWHFDRYYKYRFYFTATSGDGTEGSANAGGAAPAIYRYDVTRDMMDFDDITGAGCWEFSVRQGGSALYQGDYGED